MLLLQYRYNIPDERLIERCWRDLGFRYALGLVGTTPPPRVSSLRRFQAWVRQNNWLHRLVLSLAKEDGLIADADLQAVDSTNTECRGAVIDSYNLVATGIGRVVRLVAGCLGEPADALAAALGSTSVTDVRIMDPAAARQLQVWSTGANVAGLHSSELKVNRHPEAQFAFVPHPGAAVSHPLV